MSNLQKIGVYVRPYCLEFLRKMAEKYILVVFTASNKDYADRIIEKLDPEGNLISYRLYRHNCTVYEDLFVKDLRVFENVEISDMVIIDNIICSYALNLENGIPITPYSSSDDDLELEYISNQLLGIKPFMNCVDYLERKLKLSAFYNFLSGN
jgi:CTD small phosphatase-like protein 2